ncbi:MAG: MFS transporter [Treponema sp.]|jgi:MFS family permease|nr:MFS transporter [Treponema sp.]
MSAWKAAIRTLEKTYRPEVKAGRFLTVLLLAGVSYGLYRGIQDNYLAELVHISNFERGVVEFFRELPGLLVVVILAIMYRFSENTVFKISVAIMLLGLVGLCAGGTGKVPVIFFMVIYSLGEHIMMPARSSLSMRFAKKETGGASLGLTGAIGQAGNISGYIIAAVLFALFARLGYNRNDLLSFKSVFFLAAVFGLAAFIFVLCMNNPANGGHVQRRHFYFAKKFTKYYFLEVFYGARKQIFLTFAPYVLILQYEADASLISLLMAICSGFGVVFSPFIGRLIDRIGYKIIMVTDTLILIAVCFFYGFAHRIFPHHIALIVVCANYVLDSIISLASMASSVYVQDIASNQEEITATLSTGISVNHVISILIALFGGWIWKITGIEVLFSISAFLGLMNTFYAATIKKKA